MNGRQHEEALQRLYALGMPQMKKELDSRAISFENPTGARGASGTAHGGRKGSPNRRLSPGERVVFQYTTSSTKLQKKLGVA